MSEVKRTTKHLVPRTSCEVLAPGVTPAVLVWVVHCTQFLYPVCRVTSMSSSILDSVKYTSELFFRYTTPLFIFHKAQKSQYHSIQADSTPSKKLDPLTRRRHGHIMQASQSNLYVHTHRVNRSWSRPASGQLRHLSKMVADRVHQLA